ncbi:MAG: hypothetical protein OXT64_11125 [Gammaproteobacteria bacterium]|nr:hypothetical protein [Gammaproteobacteria bacterium]
MIRKFVSGDYGLARTYWFGLLALLGASVAGFLVVLAAYEWDWVIHRAFRLECVSFVLLCVISVSIWLASGKYTGQSSWALLAKATVVLLWIGEIGRGVYLFMNQQRL